MTPEAPIDPGHEIRPADPAEFEGLALLELAAGVRFADIGFELDNSRPVARSGRTPAVVLVAGRPPVGFAWVDVLDGNAHLEEIAVLPEHGRAGIGRALVEAVAAWAEEAGFASLTLATYRDVPWNGPFYASCGFVVLARWRWTPGLRRIRRGERRAGLDDFGVRVIMTRATGGPTGSTTRGGR
jgi:GNAT superfamily N-acetyltransferase